MTNCIWYVTGPWCPESRWCHPRSHFLPCGLAAFAGEFCDILSSKTSNPANSTQTPCLSRVSSQPQLPSVLGSVLFKVSPGQNKNRKQFPMCIQLHAKRTALWPLEKGQWLFLNRGPQHTLTEQASNPEFLEQTAGPRNEESEGVRLATLQLFQQCPSTWKNVSHLRHGLSIFRILVIISFLQF